jgi:hypothetical protein
MKLRRNQINMKVDDETEAALKRLAAVRGLTVSALSVQLLTEQLDAQQKGASAVFDEVSAQFDERLAEHDRRLVNQVEVIVKPLKRELTIIKAQVDMLLECMAPERRADYQQGVAKLIQSNGVAR